jgi:uncharacterized membrane protein YcaP (DUF421 family)/DNA-directed RNA polymerase subunit RPC12/RpoP
MKTEEFKLTDVHRILIGDVPPAFFIEVIIRTVVIYFLLILSIRLMGKRMALQLNVTELTAMVALAAAIGVPIQAPDRGILPAAVIAVVVVLSERLITRIAIKNQSAEKFFHGDLQVLVENSVINYACLKQAALSRSLVIQEIRSHGIDHLGKVKRLYMESSGAFSIVKNEEAQPGLSIIPAFDDNYWEAQERCEDIYVCANCGWRLDLQRNLDVNCSKCGKKEWVNAVL